MTQTHEVRIEGSVVTKAYVSTDRDEHLREWAALQAISARAPDLVPTPLEFAAGPSLSMSLVPGLPPDSDGAQTAAGPTQSGWRFATAFAPTPFEHAGPCSAFVDLKAQCRWMKEPPIGMTAVKGIRVGNTRTC